MVQTLYSSWKRNGEDLVYYEPDFEQLALKIAADLHIYHYELSTLGWHLHFKTQANELEVVYPFDGAGNTGHASIQIIQD